MATGPGFPSSTNVYIPNMEASGRLTVGYSRNTNKFRLPEYVQYVKSDNTVGLYMKLSPQEAGRVVTVQEYEWPDGQPRPMHTDGMEQFNMIEYRCHRYDYGTTMGWLTEKQASWPIVEQHAQIHAAKAMTARTTRVLTVATTAANWQTTADPDLSANHTATATALAGGQFDLSTTSTLYIKKALDKIAVLINEDTLGVVEQTQLHVIMNPNQARLAAESDEIHNYIKGSYFAQQEIIQGLHPNNKFGLPSQIYGYPICVENCVQVTSRKGATLAKGFAMPDQEWLVVSRVGDLDGVWGAPNFTTLTVMYYGEELGLTRFDDPKNELTEVHVTENTAELLTSPLSGYLVTATTSVVS